MIERLVKGHPRKSKHDYDSDDDMEKEERRVSSGLISLADDCILTCVMVEGVGH